MSANAFQPVGDSVKIAVTATASSAVQCKGPNNNATQRLVQNVGTKNAFLAWGPDSTVVAVVPGSSAANGMAVQPGAIMALGFPPNAWFSAICDGSDSTTLYLTPGEGN